MSGLRIVDGDLSDPRVAALVRYHRTSAHAETAPGSAHALDAAGLAAPGMSFWTIWENGALAGTGALKTLSSAHGPGHGPEHGEVKAMHTVEALRGRGVGGAMLAHIIAAAKARGMTRLMLETGSWAYCAPARAFYKRHGFAECAPFADYVPDPNSVFMARDI